MLLKAFILYVTDGKNTSDVTKKLYEENEMKKLVIGCTICLLCLSGCGSRKDAPGDSQVSMYASPLEILEKVVADYGGDELFAMYGGDQEHAVMDAPGSFAVSNTQEMDTVLGLPESQWQAVEEAASMVHMMNANTFTSAAYRLKDGTDSNAFSDAIKAHLLQRQWVCGQPDTLLIIQADQSYMLTAFGDAALLQTFENHALSVLKGSAVVAKVPVTGS